MEFVTRFFISIIIIAIGFLLVWKSSWLYQNLGQIYWAEKHLGTEGGTRLFWKLIGVLIIIGAMLYLFGFWEGIITSSFKSITPGSTF